MATRATTPVAWLGCCLDCAVDRAEPLKRVSPGNPQRPPMGEHRLGPGCGDAHRSEGNGPDRECGARGRAGKAGLIRHPGRGRPLNGQAFTAVQTSVNGANRSSPATAPARTSSTTSRPPATPRPDRQHPDLTTQRTAPERHAELSAAAGPDSRNLSTGPAGLEQRRHSETIASTPAPSSGQLSRRRSSHLHFAYGRGVRRAVAGTVLSLSRRVGRGDEAIGSGSQ